MLYDQRASVEPSLLKGSERCLEERVSAGVREAVFVRTADFLCSVGSCLSRLVSSAVLCCRGWQQGPVALPELKRFCVSKKRQRRPSERDSWPSQFSVRVGWPFYCARKMHGSRVPDLVSQILAFMFYLGRRQ